MYDIAIIGGGFAGMTAALYARRNNKSVVLLEGSAIGGQISNSPLVENYPGIASINGTELSDKLLAQITDLDVQVEPDLVLSVEDKGDYTSIETDFGKYEAKAIIIATGCEHRKLGLKDEDTFLGKGISYCAVCDGAFFKKNDVAVCGGGSTALQEAVYLSGICNSVTIIHRRDEFRGEDIWVDKAKKYTNIKYCLNSKINTLVGNKNLEKIEIENVKTNEISELKIDGLFVAIGHIPKTELFKGKLDIDEQGYFIADESCKTINKAWFVAGDCRIKHLRQLTTAVADGANAAIAACEYLG